MFTQELYEEFLSGKNIPDELKDAVDVSGINIRETAEVLRAKLVNNEFTDESVLKVVDVPKFNVAINEFIHLFITQNKTKGKSINIKMLTMLFEYNILKYFINITT